MPRDQCRLVKTNSERLLLSSSGTVQQNNISLVLRNVEIVKEIVETERIAAQNKCFGTSP